MELFETVLQQQPFHCRDGYFGACLVYWRIMTKYRLPLTQYKPDADAVEATVPLVLSERAKEARVEILKRLVKSGNLLLPTDLSELFTARSCLGESYPVYEGRFADVHLNQEEALARAHLERFVGSMLDPKGLNLASSMTVGTSFTHISPAGAWTCRCGPGRGRNGEKGFRRTSGER